MGRGKLVLKPIDDKNLREVTFRNRSRGLLKKANELAVLCDVEIGVFVFSSTGKFYPFSSVGSLDVTVNRYQAFCAAMKDGTRAAVQPDDQVMAGYQLKDSNNGERDALNTFIRSLRTLNVEGLNMSEAMQLEHQLHSFLGDVMQRKNQLTASSSRSNSSSIRLRENEQLVIGPSEKL